MEYPIAMFSYKNIVDSQIVFETDFFILVSNLYPVCEGHCMVLSKIPFKNYSHIKDYEMKNRINIQKNFISLLKIVNFCLEKIYGEKYMVIENSFNSQSVFQAHMHFIQQSNKKNNTEINLSELKKIETNNKTYENIPLFFEKVNKYDFYVLFGLFEEKNIKTLIFDTYGRSKKNVERTLDYKKIIKRLNLNYQDQRHNSKKLKQEAEIFKKVFTDCLIKNFKSKIKITKRTLFLNL
jgi:diadenosine tetraphosphate (Ap4A) HIT family hydrolase